MRNVLVFSQCLCYVIHACTYAMLAHCCNHGLSLQSPQKAHISTNHLNDSSYKSVNICFIEIIFHHMCTRFRLRKPSSDIGNSLIHIVQLFVEMITVYCMETYRLLYTAWKHIVYCILNGNTSFTVYCLGHISFTVYCMETYRLLYTVWDIVYCILFETHIVYCILFGTHIVYCILFGT